MRLSFLPADRKKHAQGMSSILASFPYILRRQEQFEHQLHSSTANEQNTEEIVEELSKQIQYTISSIETWHTAKMVFNLVSFLSKTHTQIGLSIKK